MNDRPAENHMDRLTLAITGAVAGFTQYLLFDVLYDMDVDRRLLMLLVALGLGFFSVLLALLGPAPLRRAMLAAAALAVPAALLFWWASFRFENPESFLSGGHAIVALSLLLAISTPFLAARLEHKDGWKSYARLFDIAWNIVVRYAAAWLFVGVVWGVLMLSDTLLGLVGVTIIDDILDLDPAPWLICGVALGLGLAIVHELRDYVSPFLLIQLLRVLMPLLLLVLAVFILALPMQGLSGLFGGLSPAATLAVVAFGGVTLISSAVHRGDEAEVQGRILRLSAQALAVLIAVPAALAVYAVLVRVGQYGLTPDRVAALVASLIVLLYAGAFAAAVLLRRNWTGRMRQANLYLAGVVVLVSALWLTPVLNPERMSVSSQLARAEQGAAPAELPIWEFSHEWGKAGRRGAEALRAMESHPERETMLALLEKAAKSDNKYRFHHEAEASTIASLEGRVPIRPEGAGLPVGALDGMRASDRSVIDTGCGMALPGGGPACVIVMAEFEPGRGGPKGIGFFMTENGWVRVMALRVEDGVLINDGSVRGLTGRADEEMIASLLAGEFEIAPVQRQVLKIRDMELFPEN